MINIKINTDYITLGSFLKFAGEVSSGSDAKDLILNEKVYVNDEVCVQRGKKLKNGDKVKIDDKIYMVEKI